MNIQPNMPVATWQQCHYYSSFNELGVGKVKNKKKVKMKDSWLINFYLQKNFAIGWEI